MKKWNKISAEQYTFSFDGKEVGSMEFSFNSLSITAAIKIGDKDYTIKRTGFWQNSIVVTSKNLHSIIKVYSEKWYSRGYIIEYNGRKYKLLIRNNPLAEWVIFLDNQEILAYGTPTDKTEIGFIITSSKNSSDYLFDFLLWYLIVPIAGAGEDVSMDILV